MKFLSVVAEKNINSKYLNKIWQLIKFFASCDVTLTS